MRVWHKVGLGAVLCFTALFFVCGSNAHALGPYDAPWLLLPGEDIPSPFPNVGYRREGDRVTVTKPFLTVFSDTVGRTGLIEILADMHGVESKTIVLDHRVGWNLTPAIGSIKIGPGFSSITIRGGSQNPAQTVFNCNGISNGFVVEDTMDIRFAKMTITNAALNAVLIKGESGTSMTNFHFYHCYLMNCGRAIVRVTTDGTGVVARSGIVEYCRIGFDQTGTRPGDPAGNAYPYPETSYPRDTWARGFEIEGGTDWSFTHNLFHWVCPRQKEHNVNAKLARNHAILIWQGKYPTADDFPATDTIIEANNFIMCENAIALGDPANPPNGGNVAVDNKISNRRVKIKNNFIYQNVKIIYYNIPPPFDWMGWVDDLPQIVLIDAAEVAITHNTIYQVDRAQPGHTNVGLAVNDINPAPAVLVKFGDSTGNEARNNITMGLQRNYLGVLGGTIATPNNLFHVPELPDFPFGYEIFVHGPSGWCYQITRFPVIANLFNFLLPAGDYLDGARLWAWPPGHPLQPWNGHPGPIDMRLFLPTEYPGADEQMSMDHEMIPTGPYFMTPPSVVRNNALPTPYPAATWAIDKVDYLLENHLDWTTGSRPTGALTCDFGADEYGVYKPPSPGSPAGVRPSKEKPYILYRVPKIPGTNGPAVQQLSRTDFAAYVAWLNARKQEEINKKATGHVREMPGTTFKERLEEALRREKAAKAASAGSTSSGSPSGTINRAGHEGPSGTGEN